MCAVRSFWPSTMVFFFFFPSRSCFKHFFIFTFHARPLLEIKSGLKSEQVLETATRSRKHETIVERQRLWTSHHERACSRLRFLVKKRGTQWHRVSSLLSPLSSSFLSLSLSVSVGCCVGVVFGVCVWMLGEGGDRVYVQNALRVSIRNVTVYASARIASTHGDTTHATTTTTHNTPHRSKEKRRRRRREKQREDEREVEREEGREDQGDQEKMKREREMKKRWKRRCFFFLKNVWELPKFARWIGSTYFKKKSLSDELLLIFFESSQKLTVFSIIYMIRIRFFGPVELIQRFSGGTL